MWQDGIHSLPDGYCYGRDVIWLRSVRSDLPGPDGGFSLTTTSQYGLLMLL